MIGHAGDKPETAILRDIFLHFERVLPRYRKTENSLHFVEWSFYGKLFDIKELLLISFALYISLLYLRGLPLCLQWRPIR